MVTGIEKFREYFVAHQNQYAIIGGTACDLLFNAAGLNFTTFLEIVVYTHEKSSCPSVVSHKYAYEAARAFWLSARRDDL